MREGCRWEVVAVVGVVTLHIAWERTRVVLRNERMPSQCGWRRCNGDIGNKRCLNSGIELEFQDPKEAIEQGQYKEKE